MRWTNSAVTGLSWRRAEDVEASYVLYQGDRDVADADIRPLWAPVEALESRCTSAGTWVLNVFLDGHRAMLLEANGVPGVSVVPNKSDYTLLSGAKLPPIIDGPLRFVFPPIPDFAISSHRSAA